VNRRAILLSVTAVALAGPAAVTAARAPSGGLPPNSPDGLVVFSRCCSPTGIYTISPVDRTERLLYKPKYDDTPLTPSWSPNGRSIAYIAGPQAPGVWVMSATGGHKHRITRGSGDASSPTWSTTGTKIAFADLASSGAKTHDIWIVRTNGTGLTRLTHTAADEGGPKWAPNDKSILYQRGRGVWQMRTNGTHQHRLIANASAPDWSPGATHIAFIRQGDPWIANADGSGARQLAHTPEDDVSVTWSPDGRYLLLTQADRGDIQVMQSSGSVLQPLTQQPDLFNSWPDWQRKPGK
jgi:Tol biopolymer transport system component